MDKQNILVIGSANADLVIHTDRLPKLGETIIGKNFAVNAGGKGLNQAVAISKLGGKVSFFGAVGDDSNGNMLLDTLKDFGVDFVGNKVSNISTGTAVITVIGGDNVIILNAGANDTITPDFIEKNTNLIKKAGFVVLRLEIPIKTVVKICEIAKQSNTTVILNPAPYKQLPDCIFQMIDYIIPNEHEAQDITGITLDGNENCICAVEKLKNLGVKNVIITLGERGCVYNAGDKIIFNPALPTTVIDTTSAGDSFIGALTTKLAETCTLFDAIAFATKVAAITISREGAAKSIPFSQEISL